MKSQNRLGGWIIFSLALVVGGMGSLTARGTARADDISWANAAGGDWNTGANWTGESVPGPTDNALITLDGTYTVTVSSDATIASITLGAISGTQTLTLSGGTFTVNGPSDIDGPFNQTSGTLSGSASVTLNGASSWTGGSMTGSGTTIIAPTGTLAIGGTGDHYLTQGRVLRNDGTTTWTSGFFGIGGGTFTNNGTFNANTSAALVCTGTSDCIMGFNGIFNNAGTFTKQGSGTVHMTSGGCPGGCCGAGGTAFNNFGIVDVQAGTLGLRVGGTSDGTFTVSPGSVIELNGTHNINAGASVDGAGTLIVVGGMTTFTDAPTGGGNVGITDGTAKFEGVCNFSGSLVQSGGTLGGSGMITFGGIGSTWTGGSMTGTGTTVIGASGTLAIAGTADHYLIQGRVLRNDGTTTWTSGFLGIGGGTFTNNGTFNANTSTALGCTGTSDCIMGFNGIFNNAGTFTKQGSGTVHMTSGGCPGGCCGAGGTAFNNFGIVDVQAGTLGLRVGGTSDGTFTVSPGSVIELNGTHNINAGASVDGAGTLIVVGGMTTFTDAPTGGGNVGITDGTAKFEGVCNFSGSLVQSGGTLGGSGMITFGGIGSTWTGGSMTGSGTTIIAQTGTLAIGGTTDHYLIQGRVLRNDGTTTWTSGFFGIGGGTFTNNGAFNADTNSFLACTGTNDCSMGFNGILNNAGTFTKQGSGTVHMTSGGCTGGCCVAGGTAFNNSGLVDVQAGIVRLSYGGISNGAFTAVTGTRIELSGTHSITDGAVIDGAGRFAIVSGITTFAGGTTGMGNLEISGIGTANFDGTAMIGGGLEQTSGTLGGAGTLTLGGACSWTGGAMTGSGTTIIAPTGTLAIAGTAEHYLTQGRVLRNDGTTTWTTGFFGIGGGTFTNNGAFNADTNSFLSCTGTNDCSMGFNGIFNNAGTFTKQGGGTVHMTSGGCTGGCCVAGGTAFNNSGLVDVQAGIVQLSFGGTVSDGSTIDGPGVLVLSGGTFAATGITTCTGNLDVLGGATLNMAVGGVLPGIGYSQINIGGHGTFNGALNVTVAGGFAPADCDEFVIITYGTRSGGFSSKTFTGLPPCVLFDPIFDNVTGSFTLVSTEDCECDGNLAGACCISETQCVPNQTTSECESAGGVPLGDCTTCPMQNAAIFSEPGGEIFVHVVGPPVECPSSFVQCQPAAVCPPGQPMIDPWVSPPDPTMCHNFGVSGSPAIPAGFFGPGSDPFSGSVCLKGEPLGMPEFGGADTLIERPADPFDRCEFPSATVREVPLEIMALSLVSVNPMTVTENGGMNPQTWNVAVDLSPTVTPPAGMLTVVKTHCNGGTYTSTLNVQPRFTFTKVGQPTEVRVLDTGMEGIPHVSLVQSIPVPWVSVVDPGLAVRGDPCSDFHAGVDQMNPRAVCDADNDTVLDVYCDRCPGSDDSVDADTDGAPDACDNCPTTANPNQGDCNHDAVGDACETDPAQRDDDADGRCNGTDNCPADFNPDQADCDSNGIGDLCQYCGSCQLYGDVVPGFCLIDVDDLVCVLDDFVNMGNCVGDGDIFPCDPDGIAPYDHGDGINDVDDIVAVLQAFVGFPYCPDPCTAGGCIADFDGNPNTPDECRDQFQMPGGMSEQDCCLVTANTGFFCGEGVRCGDPGCP